MIRERLIQANGIQLHLEDRGDPQAPAIILIMGLACQMTVWPEPLLNQLCDAGFRVIRFDNRDIGLSTKIESRVRTALPVAYARYKVGLPVKADYSLHDMAEDVLGLMDALELERVHLLGVSMGGMVAQILAATDPQRVHSLTLLMTSDNNPRLPLPNVGALWAMDGDGVLGHELKAAQLRGLAFWSAVRSRAYPITEEPVPRRVVGDYHRNDDRSGAVVRQIRAILATGSLELLASRITAPTQIIHGLCDPLIRVDAAQELAEHIPAARLEIVPGIGHDLPELLLPKLVSLIVDNAKRCSLEAVLEAESA